MAVNADVQAFLVRVEQLLREGFKGAITLQCPGDTSIRTMELRQYVDLATLGDTHAKG